MKIAIAASSVALTATFVVGFGVAVVLAGGQAAKGPAKPSDTYDPSKTQTLTGCLKPGDIKGSFVLAEAAEGKAAGSKATYALVGVVPAGVKLETHVNHKVEVAGTIGEGAPAKTVNMHTFKMVADKCS